MAANLTNPFGPSCCDGGECGINDRSAQSCGCDLGANHMCERHALEEKIKEEFDSGARETAMTVMEFLPTLIYLARCHADEYALSDKEVDCVQAANEFVKDFS